MSELIHWTFNLSRQLVEQKSGSVIWWRRNASIL